MSVEPYHIYQSMMLDIKIRIRTINKILEKDGEEASPLDVEFCFLQIRKIIEQICFASILCDESRYKDFRKLEGETNEKEHGNYECDWNSKIILTKLKHISPHFMPIPLGKVTSLQANHHYERNSLNATHTKLTKMYKTCGSFMHIPKPFGELYESYVEKQRQKYGSAKRTKLTIQNTLQNSYGIMLL